MLRPLRTFYAAIQAFASVCDRRVLARPPLFLEGCVTSMDYFPRDLVRIVFRKLPIELRVALRVVPGRVRPSPAVDDLMARLSARSTPYTHPYLKLRECMMYRRYLVKGVDLAEAKRALLSSNLVDEVVVLEPGSQTDLSAYRRSDLRLAVVYRAVDFPLLEARYLVQYCMQCCTVTLFERDEDLAFIRPRWRNIMFDWDDDYACDVHGFVDNRLQVVSRVSTGRTILHDLSSP